jgi:hypothetical protein
MQTTPGTSCPGDPEQVLSFFHNGAPIVWHSKRQATIETGTLARVCCTKCDGNDPGLRYKLRMFVYRLTVLRTSLR